MSVMSTTFSALAFNLTFLREQGILKRIRGTPLPSSVYLGAITGSAVTNTAFQIAIITSAGKLFFGVNWPHSWVMLVIFVIVGVCCFTALGVALSHAIPNFEAAPAYINAVFLPVIFISGVFYDADRAPALLVHVAEVLPLIHLIDGLSAAMVTGKGMTGNWSSLAVLAAWAAVGGILAVRGFSWESRKD